MTKAASIADQSLKFVQLANEALGTAVKIAREAATDKQAAVSKGGRASDLMKQTGLIDEHEEKVATDQLGSHEKTVDILTNVLEKFRDTNAKLASADLGAGVVSSSETEQRSGSVHHKNAHYVGYHRGDGEHSEADRALLRLIDRDPV